MKTKAQKRLEAIQRLERSTKDLRNRSAYHDYAWRYSDEELAALVAKRHAEAKRLRFMFKEARP